MTQLLRVIALLLSASACTASIPKQPPADASGCAAGCNVPKAVCDLGTQQCVQCTSVDSSACTDKTPVCGADNTCQPCTEHSQCASNVCLAGSCSDPSDVAYVDSTGMGDTCTKDAPCLLLSTALNTSKSYIKMNGLIEESDIVTVSRSVTILAEPNARLTRKTPGDIIQITGSPIVQIDDLEITGATGVGISILGDNRADVRLEQVKITKNTSGGAVISGGGNLHVISSMVSGNQIGLQALDRGTLTVTKSIITSNSSSGIYVDYSGTANVEESTISASHVAGLSVHNGGTAKVAKTSFSSNGTGIVTSGGLPELDITQSTISENLNGGVKMEDPTTFDISNNLIVRNGSAENGIVISTVAGAYLKAAAGSKFEFNTVVGNQVFTGASASGVICFGNIGIYNNNLMFRNVGGPQAAAIGGCSYGNSFLGESTGNAPSLRSPDSPPYDYHLTASTPTNIRDVVDCSNIANLVDIDGDARPRNGKCDLGADEY